MDWTYSAYSGANYGICIGLGVIILVAVLIIYCTSNKGKDFVIDRVIGVDPTKAEDEDEDETENEEKKDDNQNEDTTHVEGKKKDNEKNKSKKPTKLSVLVIGGFFCFFAILTLAVTAVLIFQACILANIRVVPEQDCPDYPMDCFVFNSTSHTPLSENRTFKCYPNNNTQFPNNLTDPSAVCFGWIISLQTTENILNQLGVCTGLIGLFTTLTAVIVYLGKTIKTILLSIAFIACCITVIILLIFYKYSFSALTYAVLILGVALGLFGLALYCILPKRKKTIPQEKSNQPMTNKQNVSSVANLSPPKTSIRSETPAYRTKSLQRSAKVTPK